MALVVMNTGQAVTMKADKAADLYRVLNGEQEGTEAQVIFASKVSNVYLNPASPSCPQSYRDAHMPVPDVTVFPGAKKV